MIKPTTSTTSSGNGGHHVRLLFWKRIFTIAIIITFTVHIITRCMIYMEEKYIVPTLNAMDWTDNRSILESTYYKRICTSDDITTKSRDDLIIPSNMTLNDSTNLIRKHGMGLLSPLLSSNTSDELRAYIVQRNKALHNPQQVTIHAHENRSTLTLGGADHPIISRAFYEIASHEQFRSILESLLGENPAIYEFQSITASYGADRQPWHQDVSHKASARSHAASFANSYALFIPLQDTTSSMGATAACPGTHYCANSKSALKACVLNGFRLSKTDDAKKNSNGTTYSVGEDVGIWAKGSGFLMNSQSFHRGSSHTDPMAMDRVMLVFVFASRPRYKSKKLNNDNTINSIPEHHQQQQGAGDGDNPYQLMIPLGTALGLRWNMWGFTFNDMLIADRVMAWPWNILRSMGISSSINQDIDEGWTYIRITVQQMVNESYLIDYYQEVHNLIGQLKLYSGYIMAIFVILFMSWFTFFVSSSVSSSKQLQPILPPQDKYNHQKKWNLIPSSLSSLLGILWSEFLQLILILGCISTVVLSLVFILSNLNIAKDMENGRYYSRPFFSPSFIDFTIATNNNNTNNETEAEAVRPSVEPTREDILIGKRFLNNDENTDNIPHHFIMSYTKFLEFHPGNMAFQQAILSSLTSLDNNDDNGRTMRIQLIVEEIILKEECRFLIQNDLGLWVELLSVDEVMNAIMEIGEHSCWMK